MHTNLGYQNLDYRICYIRLYEVMTYGLDVELSRGYVRLCETDVGAM